MNDEDRKLIERARYGSSRGHGSHLFVPLSAKEMDRLIVLAERGAEVEGATEAWMIRNIGGIGTRALFYDTKEKAIGVAEAGGDKVQLERVLILTKEGA